MNEWQRISTTRPVNSLTAIVTALLFAGFFPANAARAGQGLASLCGDAVLDSGETCDDGNSTAGDGCSADCAVEAGFECSAPIAATTGNNVIADPGFEGGTPNAAWAESSAVFGTPICDANCGDYPGFAGDWYVLFGGNAAADFAAVEQPVTIPAAATVLEFDLLMHACSSGADQMRVLIDELEVFNTGVCLSATDYVRQQVDIQGYADDQPHTLRFEATMPGDNESPGAFLLGDIAISDQSGGVPAQPSVCSLAPQTCEAFEYGSPGAGDLTGWTRFNTGPLNRDWTTTDDPLCGGANWTAGNHTGGTGEAACIDSDSAGAGRVDAWLCSSQIDYATAANPVLEFSYKYHPYGSVGADDRFEVWVGTSPPDAVSVSEYELVYDSQGSGGPLARTPGRDTSIALTPATAYVCYRFGGDNDWYAQVDDFAVRAENCSVPDSDGDGLTDNLDNCVLAANADQLDADGDGFGNVCDGDLNNNCTINFTDLGAMKAVFFSNDPVADLNGSGAVNFADLGLLKAMIFLAPGPSGIPNICDGS